MRPSTPLSILAALATGTTGLAAASDLWGAPCFEACQMTLRPVKFNTDATGSPRANACQSRLALTSLFLCTRVYCTVEERTAGLNAHNETCRSSAQSSLPPFDLIANYTDEDISRLRRLENGEPVNSVVFGNAVIPSDTFFGLAYKTLEAWSYVYRHHVLYGSAVLVFWVLVVAVGLLSRVLVSMSYASATKRMGWQSIPLGEPGETDAPGDKRLENSSRPHVWLKRYLTVPATFGYRNAQPFGWYTVPPRAQSLTLLVFVIINVAFCVHGYRVFPDNMYFPKVSSQAWRYISDRTGIISFANFPIIWLFGMRNNLLMWLTGWDFGTYNDFHRWVARVSTVQAVVHSVGYTILVFDDGGWTLFSQYWEQMWWWTGELATIFMCLLLGVSLYWIRRNTYEVFLVLHIGVSILILATMWGHVSIFKGRYDFLVRISCIVWALDRVMRSLRTLSFNPMFWNTRAQATYDPDSNMVRLRIPCSKSWYTPQPGTFYYLHSLNDFRFWESHPFTMAALQIAQDSETITSTGHQSPGYLEEDESLMTPQDGDTPLFPGHGSNLSPSMTFLVRPYDGFTKRLRDAAAASYPRPASLRMLVEGPYGHTQPFHRFDNMLFIVGGSGIVVPLVHLQELCKPTSSTKTVRIVWAVREAAFAASVLRDDFRGAFDSGKLVVDVYVTREHSQDSQYLAEVPKEARVLHDRPRIHEEVEDAVRDLAGRGSLAVVACGPARMADDARKAAVDMLGREMGAIEYFEESFRW